MITVLATIALVVLIVLVVLTAALWRGQERIVWQPPAPPFPAAPHVMRMDYEADDGQRLFAYVVGDSLRTRGAVLAFHGNADLAVWQVPWAEELSRRTGLAVVLPEYRGYGGLDGDPTYAGSQADARAAYRALREALGVPADRITLFGHSLGTAVATELASSLDAADGSAAPPLRAVVLQSPFTSARDMARLIAPALLLWEAISRVHFDTERRVRALRDPVWVAHGARDLLIPVRMGRRVFEAARARGELLVVPAAGHNDVPEAGGEAYWAWLGRAVAGTTVAHVQAGGASAR